MSVKIAADLHFDRSLVNADHDHVAAVSFPSEPQQPWVLSRNIVADTKAKVQEFVKAIPSNVTFANSGLFFTSTNLVVRRFQRVTVGDINMHYRTRREVEQAPWSVCITGMLTANKRIQWLPVLRIHFYETWADGDREPSYFIVDGAMLYDGRLYLLVMDLGKARQSAATPTIEGKIVIPQPSYLYSYSIYFNIISFVTQVANNES